MSSFQMEKINHSCVCLLIESTQNMFVGLYKTKGFLSSLFIDHLSLRLILFLYEIASPDNIVVFVWFVVKFFIDYHIFWLNPTFYALKNSIIARAICF